MGRNPQQQGSSRAKTSAYGTSRRQWAFFCWVAGSAALMVVGAFGPWLKLFGHPIRGTDRDDGWVVVSIAAFAAAAFILMRRSQLAAIPAIAGGALAAYTAIATRRILDDVDA